MQHWLRGIDAPEATHTLRLIPGKTASANHWSTTFTRKCASRNQGYTSSDSLIWSLLHQRPVVIFSQTDTSGVAPTTERMKHNNNFPDWIQYNTIVVYWKYRSWQKPQLRLQDII